MRHKIHWLCNAPSPYNDYLFRTLAADPELDLLVHFRKEAISLHPWSSAMAQGFPSRICHPILGFDWDLFRVALGERKSIFVIGGWTKSVFLSTIFLLILRQKPFINWVDTPRIDEQRNFLKELLRSWILRFVFRNSFSVMGTGRPALAVLEKMGCPRDKLINFPYFIDIQSFSPGLKERSQNITFVSSGVICNAIKGFDIACSALSQVIKNNPHANVCYRIAGTGPDETALKHKIALLGIKRYVELVGWVEPTNLPSFYRSGDVFLFPSRIDNYGVAVLEAMACGLPTIGSDSAGAVQDRIRHGVNGFIYSSENENELADYMAYFLAHPEGILKMSKAARANAEDWPVERGINILKKIAKSIL